MNYNTYTNGHVSIQFSTFEKPNELHELHALAHITNIELSFEEQVNELQSSIIKFIAQTDLTPLIARILLSDATNQAKQSIDCFATIFPQISYIQQPPLDKTKIAILFYLSSEKHIEHISNKSIAIYHNGLKHILSTNIVSPQANPYNETTWQLEQLENMLHSQSANIADNCIRTWFFVQNIDTNYNDVVQARKSNFLKNGLTEQTHYIASTGIAGRHADKNITSILDAYSIVGIKPDKIRYLYASENMNRTSEYGVTFERGVAIDYVDRRHIFISGTASIDKCGQVLYAGNIYKQTERMIQNVEALLNEANASFNDVAHIIIYLRDLADYSVVNKIFSNRFSSIPWVITLAPVCRPTWLIEMECVAIK